MEELNIEELQKRKAEIQEMLADNAETVRKFAKALDIIKNWYGRKQLINGIISFFTYTGLSIACFTLGSSTFTNVLGWIFVICAGLLFFVLIVLFFLIRLIKKQVNTVTDINANLEKELKEINDKLAEKQTVVKKTRRSKKNKSAEVNE